MKIMLSILLTGILTENFILAKFLGICPFLGVSKKLNTAVGMSAAVIFVMLLATAVTYPINAKLLVPNDLEYLQTIVFILVIAALVQLVEIVLKKYSPMADLTAFAQQYVEAISQSLGLPVAITDRDSVIAVAGMPKKELMGKELHSELESVINDRKAIVARKGDAKFIHITTDDLDYDGQVVQTIISEGDAVGSVIVLVRDSGHRIGEIEQKAAVIAAAFLGKQMEG